VEKQLKEGDRFELRGYDITFEKLLWIKSNDTKERVVAQLGIERDGERIFVGYPEKEFYKGQKQPISEVDLRSTLKEDLYMILADFKGDNLVTKDEGKTGYFKDASVTIKVYVMPMVKWMWTGGWVIAFGTMIAVWPDRLEARRRTERLKRQEAIFMPAQE
jgi:cytochrome c-type biogenesis protein CcmF